MDGVSFKNVTHHEAVNVFRKPASKKVLKVRKVPRPSHLKMVDLTKNKNERWGLILSEGLIGCVREAAEVLHNGVFIYSVQPGGAVKKDGRLKPGMRVLEINNKRLVACGLDDIKPVLKGIGDKMELEVCDCYDFATLEEKSYGYIRVNIDELQQK